MSTLPDHPRPCCRTATGPDYRSSRTEPHWRLPSSLGLGMIAAGRLTSGSGAGRQGGFRVIFICATRSCLVYYISQHTVRRGEASYLRSYLRVIFVSRRRMGGDNCVSLFPPSPYVSCHPGPRSSPEPAGETQARPPQIRPSRRTGGRSAPRHRSPLGPGRAPLLGPPIIGLARRSIVRPARRCSISYS